MKNNIIKAKDYDQYYIPVSLSSLLHKKKQKFIFEQLEQRHPCFTEAFCFDSKLKIINRKMFLDVIVMKKISLMEYKKNLIFPGLGFRLEKGKRKFCFSDRRWNIFLFVFLLLSILMGIHFSGKNKLWTEEDILTEPEVADETALVNQKICLPGESGVEFLNIVKNESGIIAGFVWKIDGYREEIKANITHMYPECFDYGSEVKNYSFETSPVIYKNSEPGFVFQSKQMLQLMEFQKRSDDDFFMKDIRNQIQQGGGVLIEENHKPLRVKFNCYKNLAVLSNVAKLLEQKEIGVGELKIEYEGDQRFLVELTCTKEFSFMNGIPLNVIQNYSNLFIPNNIPVIKTKTVSVKEKNSGKRLGSIGYEDGRKLVFYKNENGKIEKIMED